MKTRRFAIAAEKGRVGERRDQACGFVSRIIARRDGGGSIGWVYQRVEGEGRVDGGLTV